VEGVGGKRGGLPSPLLTMKIRNDKLVIP